MSAYMVPANEDIEQALAAALAADFSRLNTLTSAGGLLENSGLAYAYAKKRWGTDALA